MEAEEASTSSSPAPVLAGDADIEPPATPPQKEEELMIQLPPKKELAAITKAKQRLREEEEKAKRNAVLNSQSSNNSTPLNFAPGWKKDVDFGDGTNAAVILASKSDVKSRKIRQPMKQSNRKMTDMFSGSMVKGTPSPPGKLKKNNNRNNASGNNSGAGNNKKKFSPPKSAKKRRQFEERRLAKLFEEEKENKSRLEYSYYCSAGDTDIYVEAVVKPIKGKAL